MSSIPKTIHYCWFGGKDKPEDVKEYMNTWIKHNPDYELVEWNESNFDMNLYPYAKEAYELGRFAFVTDIVRLYALYNYGGIYMDTDVEVLKSFDNFLEHEAFTGCENNEMCVTGTMGAKKNNIWIKNLLDYYNGLHFINAQGKENLTTNTQSITNITTQQFGWIPENIYQDLNSVVIYPFDVFCAKSYKTGVIDITEDTVTIHHFKGSWKSSSEKMKSSIMTGTKNVILKIFGENTFNKINSLRKK